MANQQDLVLLVDRDVPTSNDVARELQQLGVAFVRSSSIHAIAEISISDIACACIATDIQSLARCLQDVRRYDDMGIPTIVTTSAADNEFTIACFKAGVLDVLESPLERPMLHEAVGRAMRKRLLMQQQAQMKACASQLTKLSQRERDLAQMVADGAPNKQIARAVGLSVKSVERIRRDAYRKLNVRSTAEMTRVVVLGGIGEQTTPDSQILTTGSAR